MTCFPFLGLVLLSCSRVHVVCYIGSCLFHGVVHVIFWVG